MSVLADRLRQHSREASELADAVECLEAERDYYLRQAKAWAERVTRAELSYAERVQLSKLDEFEAEMSG